MFRRILDYFNRKYEKKQQLIQLEEANKVGYKEYLTQGKCVKIKLGILDVQCTLISNSMFLSLDKDFNLNLTPVVLGVFELEANDLKIGCWNSESGEFMGYIPNDLSTGIIANDILGPRINSFLNIDRYTVVDVLDIHSSEEYRNSLNQDSLDIMGYWLGNVYSPENYNRLNESSVLKLKVNNYEK